MAAHASENPLTRNQRMVLDCLLAAGRPLTAYGLLDRLRAEGLAAPPTIYRALERLTELHHVHRIESLNAYVACCAHGHTSEVALVICRDCGNVTELEAEPAFATLKAEAKRSGVAVDKAHLELVGTCDACSGSAPVS